MSKLENTRGRSPLLAFILACMVPGLGQLYNGQASRGIVIFLIEVVGTACLFASGVWWLDVGLDGFYAIVAATVLLGLSAAVDATRTAWRSRALPVRKYNRPAVYAAIILGTWFLLPVMAVALLTPTLPHWRARSFWIPSGAMEPTLRVGDRIIVDTTAYRTAPPQRMDVIVYRDGDSGHLLIKRVVANPGEKVEIAGNGLLVDGQVVEFPAEEPSFADFGPVEVEPNTAFVIGDNWNNSRDSRFTGGVPYHDIVGKVRFIWAGPGAGTEL